jgi:DNA repair exonuclease SbcCD ATPase subunit
MLNLKSLTIKNFLSIGSQTQVINFGCTGLTLVLGENVDVGGAGSRNGVGKSTIIQALCFGLFGTPLTNIKKDNLINKTNNKNMGVTLDFEKDGKFYRIERTRKPNTIKWYVNDTKIDSPENDEAQGESKWTQHEIEKVLGFSLDLFKHIVIMSTEVIPFLNLPAKGQRDLIEELLGITQLSNKAEQLKDLVKETKENIRDEEVRIRVVIDNNEKNQKIINDIQFKSNVWSKEHVTRITKIEKALAELEHVDIDNEIESHKNLAIWIDLSRQSTQLEKEIFTIEKRIVEQSNSLEKVISDLVHIEGHSCPTCGQEVHDGKLETIHEDLRNNEKILNEKIINYGINLEKQINSLKPITEELEKLGGRPNTYYDSLDEAYGHRSSVDTLKSNLEREKGMINPYDEQILSLSEGGIQEVDYSIMNDLSKLKDHQEFLVKLLTSKDSFIRKKIIDQNLLYLNHRLSHYLEKLNLPHEVRFLNDLSTEITLLGREYDFEQLSRGEKLRVSLALTLSFRNVWESMNHSMNLLFLDEILDSGLDTQGVDLTYDLLLQLSRNNKNVFMISHREELINRALKVLTVRKENGFTQFNYVEE